MIEQQKNTLDRELRNFECSLFKLYKRDKEVREWKYLDLQREELIWFDGFRSWYETGDSILQRKEIDEFISKVDKLVKMYYNKAVEEYK